jgi:hypothetical protein
VRQESSRSLLSHSHHQLVQECFSERLSSSPFPLWHSLRPPTNSSSLPLVKRSTSPLARSLKSAPLVEETSRCTPSGVGLIVVRLLSPIELG